MLTVTLYFERRDSWRVASHTLTRTATTHHKPSPGAVSLGSRTSPSSLDGAGRGVRRGDDVMHWAGTIWAIYWWFDTDTICDESQAASFWCSLTWMIGCFPPHQLWVGLLLMSIREALFAFDLKFYVVPLFSGAIYPGNKSLELNSAT